VEQHERHHRQVGGGGADPEPLSIHDGQRDARLLSDSQHALGTVDADHPRARGRGTQVRRQRPHAGPNVQDSRGAHQGQRLQQAPRHRQQHRAPELLVVARGARVVGRNQIRRVGRVRGWI
jgi:hypothetical protein